MSGHGVTAADAQSRPVVQRLNYPGDLSYIAPGPVVP